MYVVIEKLADLHNLCKTGCGLALIVRLRSNRALYKQNARADFDVAVARSRDRQLDTAMPQGLSVVRCNPEWANQWDFKIGQSPRSFYETLCRNIDGEVKVYIDFFDYEDSNFTVDILKCGRTVFKTENKIFDDGRGKFLLFKEWENKDPDSRRHGIGLNLFMNMIDNAIAASLDFITLRGGREDGRFFWPAHGFYFRDSLFCERAIPQIADNLAKYSDTIPDGIQENACQILERGGNDLCWKIARLPGTVVVDNRTRPLGWALLDIPHESEYQIDLNDKEQVARVKASFIRPAAVALPKPAPILF